MPAFANMVFYHRNSNMLQHFGSQLGAWRADPEADEHDVGVERWRKRESSSLVELGAALAITCLPLNINLAGDLPALLVSGRNNCNNCTGRRRGAVVATSR